MQREKHEASFGFCSESDVGIVWNVTCVLWVAAVLLLIGAICEGKVGSEESPCGEGCLPKLEANLEGGSGSILTASSNGVCKYVCSCVHTLVCVLGCVLGVCMCV